jgi:hypothetical protein
MVLDNPERLGAMIKSHRFAVMVGRLPWRRAKTMNLQGDLPCGAKDSCRDLRELESTRSSPLVERILNLYI